MINLWKYTVQIYQSYTIRSNCYIQKINFTTVFIHILERYSTIPNKYSFHHFCILYTFSNQKETTYTYLTFCFFLAWNCSVLFFTDLINSDKAGSTDLLCDSFWISLSFFFTAWVSSCSFCSLWRAFSSRIFSVAFVFLKLGSEGSKLNKWEVYIAWNRASLTLTCKSKRKT